MASIGDVIYSKNSLTGKISTIMGETIDTYTGILANDVQNIEFGTQYDTNKISMAVGKTVTSSVVTITASQITGPRKHPLEISWKKAQVSE